MAWFDFAWTEEIIEHLELNQVSQEDFERIVCRPVRRGWSDSSDRRAAWGYTIDGRYVMAVYEMVDEITVLPVTAYEVEE